jgi:hypothetical protein
MKYPKIQKTDPSEETIQPMIDSFVTGRTLCWNKQVPSCLQGRRGGVCGSAGLKVDALA